MVQGCREEENILLTPCFSCICCLPDPESNIVCNYTSLTSVLRPLGCSASSVCKNKRKKKKCKGHFMHSLVVFVKAAFSNLLPLFFPPSSPSHMNCVTHILTLSNSRVLSSVLSFESSDSSLFQHCPAEWCKDPPTSCSFGFFLLFFCCRCC